ncbi:putative orfan [Tupanvirus soda lake]|uniref:Orfan n=2 Tax=Tupanvirus TaxID=2094720 RepID=A0AC62AAN9_9VIRU|nr:putative orfan [Tupanvirus soda lake]QKU34852.1 putative orfan [Tupanvirus soda lake]
MDQKSGHYAQELFGLYQISKDIFSVRKNMKPFIKKLFEAHDKIAEEYFVAREDYNSKMLDIANRKINELTLCFVNCDIHTEFIMTSSLNAGTNLVGESDIDISMLVSKLDESAMHQITLQLEKMGFVYNKFVNPSQILNCYYSFSKIDGNVEFEIKVRDKENSATVLALHDYMENNLTNEERMAITYGKFLFKNLSKHSLIEVEKKSYAIFKKMVYEMYFAKIEGGFMLELHY